MLTSIAAALASASVFIAFLLDAFCFAKADLVSFAVSAICCSSADCSWSSAFLAFLLDFLDFLGAALGLES